MLAVSDVGRAAAWYVHVFGLVEHVRVGAAHRVQLGVDGERAEVIVRELKDGERVSGTTYQVMLRVDDVDTVLRAAAAAGADADAAARDMPNTQAKACASLLDSTATLSPAAMPERCRPRCTARALSASR